MKRLLENTGKEDGKKVTFGEAAIAEGYSPKYVNSGSLQRTDAWQELLSEHLPDDLVARRHKELLNKTESLIRVDAKTGKVKVDKTNVIDVQAVKSALDMAYKLKRRYDNTINVTGEIGKLSDAEIEDRIAGVLSGIIGAIQGKGTEAEE